MTEPDDVKVSLDLMDERWPGYSTPKHIIRKEIEDLRRDKQEVLDAFRHIHRARRIVTGERTGQLTDACSECGLDIRHEIHERMK